MDRKYEEYIMSRVKNPTVKDMYMQNLRDRKLKKEEGSDGDQKSILQIRDSVSIADAMKDEVDEEPGEQAEVRKSAETRHSDRFDPVKF